MHSTVSDGRTSVDHSIYKTSKMTRITVNLSTIKASSALRITLYFVVTFIVCVALIMYSQKNNYQLLTLPESDYEERHAIIVKDFFKRRQAWNTSNLGSILFKNLNSSLFVNERRQNRTFVVLIWKYWDWLSPRHIYNYHKTNETSEPHILKHCSVKNCVFTSNNNTLNTADAVVVHVQKGQQPNTTHRNLTQRWIFLSDEAAPNTFSLAKKGSRKELLKDFSDKYNWTMTFRSDADIPVPYGRTIPLSKPIEVELDSTLEALEILVPNWNKKTMNDVLIAILMSNCKKSRMAFLEKLQKHIKVDVIGRCGTVLKKTCPGHYKRGCFHIQSYLFYLVLENSSCKQYMTEKVFFNAYTLGAIPVIVGPSLQDCMSYLPPDSFIYVNDVNNLKHLADEIQNIALSFSRLLHYHKWRMHFEVRNEHGYFGTNSYHYCRVCEALNYNDGKDKTYSFSDLKLFFDSEQVCKKRTDYEFSENVKNNQLK